MNLCPLVFNGQYCPINALAAAIAIVWFETVVDYHTLDADRLPKVHFKPVIAQSVL